MFQLNIEQTTLENTDYRRVLYTSHYTQLVVMSLEPGVEIGNEIHGLDQFIRLEAGEAEVILQNGAERRTVKAEEAIIIPAGTWHNIINTGKETVKLYTLYSPPAHLKETVQKTKADEVEDHFDGRVSE